MGMIYCFTIVRTKWNMIISRRERIEGKGNDATDTELDM